MDTSVAKRVINENLKAMRWLMGLQEWSIDMEYGPIPNEHSPLFTKADVLTVDSHKKCRVRIDPSQHDSPAELLESFRHELIDIMHAELQLFKRQAIEALGAKDKVDKALEHAWQVGVEALVRKVEGMLDELGYTPARFARAALKHRAWWTPRGAKPKAKKKPGKVGRKKRR